MKISRIKHKKQCGLTIIEVVMALGVGTILLFAIGFAYLFVFRGSMEIQKTTDMQRKLKLAFIQMKRDLGNAGGGMPGDTVFAAPLDSSQVTFSYVDRLKKQCHENESTIAKITFLVRNDSLLRELYCGGSKREEKAILTSPDSLAVNFNFYDDDGAPTAYHRRVRTVEFTLEIFDGQSGQFRKSRLASGHIHINK